MYMMLTRIVDTCRLSTCSQGTGTNRDGVREEKRYDERDQVV